MSTWKGAAAGLSLLSLIILSSGLYTLGEGEAAVVVEVQSLQDRGVKVVEPWSPPLLSTPLGKFYWRLPWPLGLLYKISLGIHTFEARKPMVFRLSAAYHLIMTMEGFEAVSSYDIGHYDALVLYLKGSFKVAKLQVWAQIYRYGEADDWVRYYMTRALEKLVEDRLRALYEERAAEYTGEANEGAVWEALTKGILENPRVLIEGIEEYLPMLEETAGIEVLRDMEVSMRLEPISELHIT